MGLFGRKKTTVEQWALLPGGAQVHVFGESHYQAALEEIAGGKTEYGCDQDVVACLVREPKNEYDPNAIAVYIKGFKVGYIGRQEAGQYAAYVEQINAAGAGAACHAHLTGGWKRGNDEGSIGVVLDLCRAKNIRDGQHDLDLVDPSDL